MKRKHKTYSKPRRPFDKLRIDEEAKIKKDFGLKNKREIWKADAKIKLIRERAKKLVSAKEEDKKLFFDKLNKAGFKVGSIGEVLSLSKEDYLGRRLQTILLKKGLAKTPKEARQLITHKKVFVDEKIVNIPSYSVSVEMENKIKIKEKKIKSKPVVKEINDEENTE
jgi:small subunit ribosomal protein S4